MLLRACSKSRSSTETMRIGVEEISGGAHRIGDSGSVLEKKSNEVRDAIEDITSQINMFKV